MRYEISNWVSFIILALLLITWSIFYLLRKIIKWYRVPKDLLSADKKFVLISINVIIPLIPSIIIVNKYISKIPTLEGYFGHNQLLYPISMFATLVFLIIVIGILIEQFYVLTNSEYRKFKFDNQKCS